jgi:hypothetical protein
MWPHYFIVSIDQGTNQTICPQDLFPQGQQLGDFSRYRNIPSPRRLSASSLRRVAIEELMPLRDGIAEFFKSEATQTR